MSGGLSALVEQLAEKHAHDGLSPAGLRFVLDAAARAPLGPFLEIGSLIGGTSLALMDLLEILHRDVVCHDCGGTGKRGREAQIGAAHVTFEPGRACARCLGSGQVASDPPVLVTVDPYGGKPYSGGDYVVDWLYGDDIYLAHKQNLARFPNHVHFALEGHVFLSRCLGAPIWRRGKRVPLTEFSFAFLDGDHDAATVREELLHLMPHMARGGRIVVDNVDKDPRLVPALLGYCATSRSWGRAELGPETEPGARQAVIYRTAA